MIDKARVEEILILATNGIVNSFEDEILLLDCKVSLVLVIKIDQLRRYLLVAVLRQSHCKD